MTYLFTDRHGWDDLDILQTVVGNNYNEDILNKEFGIKVKKELAIIDARVLSPPMVIDSDFFYSIKKVKLSILC